MLTFLCHSRKRIFAFSKQISSFWPISTPSPHNSFINRLTKSRYAELSVLVFVKILLLSVISVMVLLSIIVIISVVLGIRIYKKGEDPNNFLVPITTSVADFGSMIMIFTLTSLMFA